MLLNSLSQVPALELVDFFYFIIDFIATNYLKDVFSIQCDSMSPLIIERQNTVTFVMLCLFPYVSKSYNFKEI